MDKAGLLSKAEDAADGVIAISQKSTTASYLVIILNLTSYT